MNKKSKLSTFLCFTKIITLILVSTLLLMLIFKIKDIKNSNSRVNTYIGWCKSAFDNPRNPSDEWYNKKIKKCVKGWKKIEKELKK